MTPGNPGRGAAFLLTTLLLAGCSGLGKDRQTLGLQAATSAYESAIRWGYFETAYGYLDPDLRKGPVPPATLKGIRVTEYDVVQPPMLTAEDQATQVVSINYLHDERQVVKTLADHQTWRYDPRIKTWWLTSGLPRFQ